METNTTSPDNTPLRRAVNLAGGTNAMARALGEQPNTISNWLKRGAPPVEKCPAIESLTGVKCEELRPNTDWATFKKVLCKKGRK